MGILSGIISYAFGLALNLLDAAVNGFLGALGFDLSAFEHYFPAAADFYDVIIGFDGEYSDFAYIVEELEKSL